MKAEIITIGDEILIGQIVDTNSAFLASELNKIGIAVYQITSVQDNRHHILKALEEAESRVDLILITGGLGPTKDDITKHTLCEYTSDHLVEDPKVLEHIEYLFKTHLKRPVTPLNRMQALVPSKAMVLPNRHGTAPGMWLNGKRSVLVSMPGVPHEMKSLFTEEVVPRVIKSFRRPVLMHQTLITYGMGESTIAERLEFWEESLPQEVKLAYLPNLGKVRLRVSVYGTEETFVKQTLTTYVSSLKALVSDILYGEEDGDPLEVSLCRQFSAKGLTLATAESFTGGSLAALLCSVPGASTYFTGSVVCYATAVKTDILGVDSKLIETHSVVSREVAIAMAEGVRRLMKTDFAVATTGNAGPTKGESEAPVGRVYLAIAGPDKTEAYSFDMGGHRERVIQKSLNKVMELLWQEIGATSLKVKS
jgi:nicotinamide-nucleotide amidase